MSGNTEGPREAEKTVKWRGDSNAIIKTARGQREEKQRGN